IRADLDRHLMLDIQADMPDGAEEALREKLSTFLIAYSSTDYEKYLVFRPSSTMCAIDDPRLRQQLEAWPPQLGPVPTEAAGVFAAPWRLYIAEGFGPIAAGPVIDAVKWAHCRATIRKILQQQVIGAEWDEMAPGDGHLSKEASPDAKTEGGFVSIRLCVPNVTSVAELVKRDGVLRFADFDVVCRAADSPARRLVLRFVWDGVDRTWLALHALVYGGDPRKSFVW
ncbi:MAG: hypothetical protein JXO22_09865, partial [Phycisphaerae bacterium]|nr:hypothetical protein [Phycisphaerae bacterium]